jgi:hypothetical protein
MTGFEAGILTAIAALLAHAEFTRRRQNAQMAIIEIMDRRIVDLVDELDRTKSHVSYVHTCLRESAGMVRQ